MVKASIILVHGIGNHNPHWSEKLQIILKKQLPSIGIDAEYCETCYSDLVEKSPEMKKLVSGRDSKALAADSDISEAVTNLREIQANFDLEYKKSVRATAVDKGIIDKGLKTAQDVLTYAAGYLWTDLKQKVDDRVGETIKQVLAKQDGRKLIIVGHSLGSVISYCLATEKSSPAYQIIYRLATLGSPLGAVAFRIKPQKVPCRWGNASAPGDIVSTISIDEPPFSATEGLVSLRTRKPTGDAHGSLMEDAGVIRDWIPLLI